MSCNLDDGNPETIQQVLVPITSIEMANSFRLGETYTINLKFQRPTDCHILSGISFDSDGQTQFFGVLNSIDSSDSTCIEVEGLTGETSFEFKAERNNLYIFKFWQGIDEDGEAIYLVKEVPVSEYGEDV